MPKPPTLSPPKIDSDVDVPRLLALLKTWTQCEIQGRLGAWPAEANGIDWPHRQIEIEDEIRTLLYGTNDLVVLGKRWGILKWKRYS